MSSNYIIVVGPYLSDATGKKYEGTEQGLLDRFDEYADLVCENKSIQMEISEPTVAQKQAAIDDVHEEIVGTLSASDYVVTLTAFVDGGNRSRRDRDGWNDGVDLSVGHYAVTKQGVTVAFFGMEELIGKIEDPDATCT